MSEIPFIRDQGDLLEAAITTDAASRPRMLISRLRRVVEPHKRLSIVIVALVVAGCAAVAATTLTGSTERLALGRVSCYYGTTIRGGLGDKHSDALDTGATLVNGETPQSWCRQEFNFYSAHDLRESGLTPVRNPKLIACRQDATTIAVLIASGSANQCKQAGLDPLPAATAEAFASVRRLGGALRQLYFSRNCWSAKEFTMAVRAILVRHGLGDWRIIPPPSSVSADGSPAGTAGRCAAFVYPNPYLGNPYQSLNGLNRTFTFELGMSRTDYERWGRLSAKLTNETWARCYTPAHARVLVDQTFARTGLIPKIAITAPINRGFHFAVGPNLRGLPAGYRARQRQKERHFLDGCAIQPFVWIAADDRFVDVWLTARHGRFIKYGTYPPPNSYFQPERPDRAT